MPFLSVPSYVASEPQRLKAYRQAVRLRLQGETLANTAEMTGLSVPTISKLFRLFEKGGWQALEQVSQGRPKKSSDVSDYSRNQQLISVLLQGERDGAVIIWRRSDVQRVLSEQLNSSKPLSGRESGRCLDKLGLSFSNLNGLKSLAAQVRKSGRLPEKVYQLDKKRFPADAAKRRREAKKWLLEYSGLRGQSAATSDNTPLVIIGLVRKVCLPHQRQNKADQTAWYQLCIQLPGREQLWLISERWPSEYWIHRCLQQLSDFLGQPYCLLLFGLDLKAAHGPIADFLAGNHSHIQLQVIPPLLGELLYGNQIHVKSQ